jgi:hypothetical protein
MADHLAQKPTQSYTMGREQFKKEQDNRWVQPLALWLSAVSGLLVEEETFEFDLMDGLVLCRLVSKLEGANVSSFHEDQRGLADKGKFQVIICD